MTTKGGNSVPVMAIDILDYSDVEQWLDYINTLCEIAYWMGTESAHDAAPRQSPHFDEPQLIIAWECGYNDETAKLSSNAN